MQLRHVGIVCKDIELAINFYCKNFGCIIARRMQEEGSFISKILGADNVVVETVKLSFPNATAQIELLGFLNPPSQAVSSLFNQGLTHIALQVSSLNTLYVKLKEQNINFISPPSLSVDGKALVCFCQDPNGIFLELVELVG